MELLTNLGIDGRLFAAQIVNFLILLAVLYKFLYRPVLRILDEREARIARSLEQADEMETRMRQVEADREKAILEARRTAGDILDHARSQGEELRVRLLEQAKHDAARVVEEGRRELETHKATALKEVRSEIATLVTAATEHVLGEVMDHEIDSRIVERAVERVGRA